MEALSHIEERLAAVERALDVGHPLESEQNVDGAHSDFGRSVADLQRRVDQIYARHPDLAAVEACPQQRTSLDAATQELVLVAMPTVHAALAGLARLGPAELPVLDAVDAGPLVERRSALLALARAYEVLQVKSVLVGERFLARARDRTGGAGRG